MNASLKSRLREEHLLQRMAVPPPQAEKAARAIARAFLTEPRFAPSQTIGGYMPIRSEIDILPLLTSLHQQGRTVALPVTERPVREMDFRLWQPGMEMAMNRDIAEPPASSPLVTPDLFLVPLLCYDARGHRLGYGGGYFDRTLAKLRAAQHPFLAVGVAHAFQQKPELLPAEAFDQTLDAVITEHGVEWFG